MLVLRFLHDLEHHLDAMNSQKIGCLGMVKMMVWTVFGELEMSWKFRGGSGWSENVGHVWCKFVGFCYAYLNLDGAMSTLGAFWRLEQQQTHGRQVLKIPQVSMLYVYTICVHVFARWAPNSYKWSDNPYKWPYNWVFRGYNSFFRGVRSVFITGRVPPCTYIQQPWEPKTFIFRGYNPYIGGLKPSFFMVLGSHGI